MNKDLEALRGKEKVKVLMVCLGNICRSPSAEAMFRNIVREHGAEGRITVDSAGTIACHAGQGPDERMIRHAGRRGITMQHVCRKITDDDFRQFDLIIGMDAKNLQDLRRMAPSVEDAAKVHAMSEFFSPDCRYDYVPDPYYEGAEGFELVLDLLEDSCENLYTALSGRD